MSEEIFRDIPGYEGIYQISNLGRVKSLDRTRRRKGETIAKVKGRILSPLVNKEGYLTYLLYIDGKQKRYFGHRLVMLAFVGERIAGNVIDHENRVKHDNRLENLRYVTISQNCRNSERRDPSGVIGVSFNKLHKRWSLQLTENKKQIYLGRFKTQQEAIEARCKYFAERGLS